MYKEGVEYETKLQNLSTETADHSSSYYTEQSDQLAANVD